jgi:hypothetical protein
MPYVLHADSVGPVTPLPPTFDSQPVPGMDAHCRFLSSDWPARA